MLENMSELEGLSLGKKLRHLTEQARVNVEAQELIKLMVDAANIGEDHLTFPDLRSIVPKMIMNETIFSGQVNPNTAAYEYTLYW